MKFAQMAAKVRLRTEEKPLSKQSVGQLVSEVKFLKNILHLKQSGRGVSEIIYKMKQVEEENSRLKQLLQERDTLSQPFTPISRNFTSHEKSTTRDSLFKKQAEKQVKEKHLDEIGEEIGTRDLNDKESKLDNKVSFPQLALSPISKLPTAPLEIDEEEESEEEQNQTVKRFPKLQKVQIIRFNKDRDWQRDQSQSFRVNTDNSSHYSPKKELASLKTSPSNRVIGINKLSPNSIKLPAIKSFEKLKLKLKEGHYSFRHPQFAEPYKLSPKYHFGSTYKSASGMQKGGLRISLANLSSEPPGTKLDDISQVSRNHTLWSDKFRTLSKERSTNSINKSIAQDSKLSKFLKELAELRF